MRTFFSSALAVSAWLIVSSLFAATPPYLEDFETYVVGNTAVTNFTEAGSLDWTIVSPGLASSGKAYNDAISATSPGPGSAAGTNSSSGISFPTLASSSFSMSTLFKINSLTVPASPVSNTATIRLFGRGADATPASTSSDRYEVSYFLDDDSTHTAGKLYLNEINLFFGDSLSTSSASSLPIVIGDTYQMTLTGIDSGGSITLSALLTDTITSTSISVSKADSSNLLTGSNFGYFNSVRAQDGSTSSLNADFDHFSMVVPEPGNGFLLLVTLAIQMVRLPSRHL